MKLPMPFIAVYIYVLNGILWDVGQMDSGISETGLLAATYLDGMKNTQADQNVDRRADGLRESWCGGERSLSYL